MTTVTETEQATPAFSNEEAQSIIDQANGNAPAASTEPATPDAEEQQWSDFAAELDNTADEDLDLDGSDNSTKATREPEPTPESTPAAPADAATATPEETPAATPTAEEPQTPEQPATSADPVTEVASTPQQPAPVTEPQAPTTPAEPVKSPEELQAERAEQRAQVIEHMAQSWTLSEEDEAAMLTEPSKVLPKIRANLFMDVLDAVMAGVQQQVPHLISTYNTQTTAREEHEKAFYSANPKLDQGKHSEVVNSLAVAYMQANPQASSEKMIKEVGVMAMFQLGIDPTETPAPANETPAAQPAVAPRVPPAAGAQVASTGKQVSSAEEYWGQVADELDEDF